VDPISLIAAALAAGAIVGVKDAAGQAVRDAYAGLKRLIRRRFAGNREAEAVLDQSERNPEDGKTQAQLAEHLLAAGAADDEELIRAAQAVLRQTDPAGARAGKYDVHITGGKGIVVGDAATVTMTFNDGD
jgi:YD repeat-containing protein